LDKSSLRKELLKKRDIIPPEVRKVKDGLICERLSSLDAVKKASVIFLFASFRTETDTFAMIGDFLSSGKRVVLPKVDKDNRQLLLYELKNTDELAPGYMGIPEPTMLSEDRLVDVNNVDAIIIPGAGFDEKGNRIGYGGGYYDRLLETLEKDVEVIAPAYEEQVVDSIPAEAHDKRVKMIVTDRRVIVCG
jgi:5-formyltetrahydrofolate cyclo-ligase